MSGSTTGSNILKIVSSHRKAYLACNVTGVCCIPFCCVGLACLAPAQMIHHILEQYDDVIHTYGGPKSLTVLADKIRKERVIFRDALTIVNRSCDPNIIDPDITLLDVIMQMQPRIGQIIQNSRCAGAQLLGILQKKNYAYTSVIWNAYEKREGNYSVIIYGLIEYLCQLYEPTSQYVINFVEKFNVDSALRTECLHYKDLI